MNDSINELVIRAFEPNDEQAVIDLWQRCKLVVPWNDPHSNIQIKHAFQPELFFVGILDGQVVATAMVGYEGHRGWINYLAVDPDRQRMGLGRKIMAHAEAVLKAWGCPKINLQVRKTNTGVIDFYRKLGFSDDNVIGMGKRLDKSDKG